MSSFLDPLELKPVDGSDVLFELLSPFRYWIDELHNGPVITVPKGFKTDFASIPKLFWNILPPWGRYGKAAVVHDWLYTTGMYPKEKADLIFLDAMTILGVSWVKRNTMYYAVKYFGFFAWNKHRKQDETDRTLNMKSMLSVSNERY